MFAKAYAVAIGSLLAGASVVHWAFKPDLVRGSRPVPCRSLPALSKHPVMKLAYRPHLCRQSTWETSRARDEGPT